MYSKKGVKHLSVAQMANIVTALSGKCQGAFFAFRVLSAYLACAARQEATKRSLEKAGHFVRESKGVSKAEIRALVGGDRSIERAFRLLEAKGVISRSGGVIVLTETPLPESEPLLEILCGKDEFGLKRSPARPVPVPRAWLERWASPSRARVQQLLHFVYASVLSYQSKRGGVVKNKGAFKFNRLASVLPLNARSLWHARAMLIRDGKISEDRTYSQKVLNRRGHFVEVNLEWGRETEPVENSIESDVTLQASEANTGLNCRSNRDTKHLTVSRDHKRLPPAGVCKEGIETAPSIRHIKRDDLFRASKLESLYYQAVSGDLIAASESSALNFLAAAVRARQADPDNAPRIFVGILKKQLFHHITQAQEDRAREGLIKWRGHDPGFMRRSPDQFLAVNPAFTHGRKGCKAAA